MTLRGKIVNGVVVLHEPTTLPEGTEVEIHPVSEDEDIPTLYERLREVIGTANCLPPHPPTSQGSSQTSPAPGSSPRTLGRTDRTVDGPGHV